MRRPKSFDPCCHHNPSFRRNCRQVRREWGSCWTSRKRRASSCGTKLSELTEREALEWEHRCAADATTEQWEVWGRELVTHLEREESTTLSGNLERQMGSGLHRFSQLRRSNSCIEGGDAEVRVGGAEG